MIAKSFLGIFVNPVDVQSEGLHRVFDNIQAAGATAIATTTVVGRPAAGAGGVRFPDLHVDGFARVLDRPLWGHRELHLEVFPAHESDLSLYAASSYRPRAGPVPADVDRETPRSMIAEARRRGMQSHVQVHPFVPPTVQEEDRPVYIDGSRPQPPLVVDGVCPNSPAAQAYALALVEDTMQHYGDVDGLFLDWAEFGAYRLEDHFACFCPHCEQRARAQGVPWGLVRRDVTSLWNWLHTLTPAVVDRSLRVLRNPLGLLGLLVHYPGWLHLLRFKAASIAGFYRKIRALLDTMGLRKVQISARGWPPPWNRSSGMDYRMLAEVCDAVTPKLFTFDYCALPRWYGQSLAAWNPGLPESAVLDALVEWMNLPDDLEERSFARYHIPAPDELHPARIGCYGARIDEVVDAVTGRAPCYPFGHAYLPESQWREMVALIAASRADGMWVQMYGYLSDRKLEILRETWAG